MSYHDSSEKINPRSITSPRTRLSYIRKPTCCFVGACFPEEDEQLMWCKKVALHHRLFLGLLAREGLRASELRDLEWSNLDLDRGLLTLEENKTDSPRTWTLDPGVAEALRRWAKMLSPRAKQGRYVIVHWRSGRRIAGGKAASQLKAGLTKAKVSREALFNSTATRMSIRGHEVA